MARSPRLGFSLLMARSCPVGFSVFVARSCQMGFSVFLARSPSVGFSRFLARSRPVGFSSALARSQHLDFSLSLARSALLLTLRHHPPGNGNDLHGRPCQWCAGSVSVAVLEIRPGGTPHGRCGSRERLECHWISARYRRSQVSGGAARSQGFRRQRRGGYAPTLDIFQISTVSFGTWIG